VSVFSHCVLVLDEVHNVRYLKKATENSVYGSIIRLLKLCVNVKVIIATATPMTDSPDQIHSLIGICNHSRDEPWTTSGIISYNSVVCDKPEPIQVGTEEFIPGMKVYASDMLSHQRLAYSKEHGVQPPDDIYRKLTHISLFCFGDGTHGREITESKMRSIRMKTTITSMSTRQTKEIKYMKYDILPEYAYALTGTELRNSSSKYSAVIDGERVHIHRGGPGFRAPLARGCPGTARIRAVPWRGHREYASRKEVHNVRGKFRNLSQQQRPTGRL